MSDDIYIDVNYLTESERNIILQVLAKDDELRRQEKKRLSKLKTELDTIKYSGLEAQQLSANSKVCARCKEGFGTIFNTGAFCPKCKVRVCKNCRSTIDGYWVCLLCAKVREVKAKSGAWFFENEPKKTNKPALHGSVLLRASLKRTKKSALPPLKPVIAEPPPPPIINLNLKEHEKLHRPVAVHMSPLREAEDDQPYEVNSNYYKSNGHPTVEVNTRTVEETKKTSVDSRGSSTSSHSEYDQTFRLPEHTDSSGYQENRPIFDYLKESEEERPVFDYLKDHRSSPSSDALSDTKYDGQMEDLKGFTNKTTNGHVTSYDKPEHEYRDEYGYEDEQRPGYKDEQRHGYKDEQRHGYKGEQKHGFEIEQRPGYEDKQKFGYEGDKSPDYKDSATSSFEDEQRPEYEDKQVPGYEVDHRSGYQDELKPGYQGEHRLSYQGSETSGTYHDAQSWRSQDSQLDTDSLDTFTSGEFLTPKETPNHSDVNTPVQSSPDHSDEGDSYRDARDATPVPMDRDSIDGSPLKYGNHDLVPPQITTTAISDDEGDKFGETQMDETQIDGTQRPRGNDEDIDQAFHDYGSSDFGGLKLQDRLEMGSRESIVSYYSDAGEGNYGNIPVTGEVQVGLRYDYKHEKLEVQVHRARDIAPVDTKKKRSDPYIKVYLLPDKTKGGKRKTKTKKHTLDPTFDEILQFKIGFDEMLTRTLWLTVWNHDRFGHNDFLGEIMLPLAQYDESGFNWAQPSAEWYPLRERRPEPSLMKYCGEIVVSLKYAPPATPEAKGKGKKKKKHSEKGELQVVIKEARNLPAKDANGFSDPFVKAYLLPDKGRKSKRKTPTIRKNLNPQWNFPFTYDDVTLEELMDRSLELTVWDWDRGASNDFLGGVRLGMGTKQEKWDDAEGQEITAWQAMMDFPNEWHDSTLTLRSSMDHRV